MADISLIGIRKDIEVSQGSSVRIVFELRDENGAALDMSDWDIRSQVRATYTSTSPLINCTLQNGKLAWVSRPTGKFALEILPSDTASLRFPADTPESYEAVYDIEVVAPVNDPRGTSKPWYGTFTILREVTR